MVEMEKLALKNINYWHKVFIHIMGHESKHWYTTEICAQSTECSQKTSAKKQSNSHNAVEKKSSNINQRTLILMKKPKSQAAIKSTECSQKKWIPSSNQQHWVLKKKGAMHTTKHWVLMKKPAMHELKHWVLRRKFHICTCHKKNIYFLKK